MSLARATLPDGSPIELEGGPPFAATDLVDLAGVDFDLPCGDPWIRTDGTRGHAYLEGAAKGWDEYPDWMDFLDPDSPCRDLKMAERDLYLYWWRDWMRAERVLDVGCGIGRFTMPFLDRGKTVIGIDADLQSLRHCAWHAAGRPGRLDLHWTTVARMPDVDGFDIAIACEVLCYVPDAEAAVAAIAKRLKPGGALLLSVEARWGWAVAEDAPEGGLAEALAGTGVLDLPGDRWVRTFERDQVQALLEGAGLEIDVLEATHYVTDGPLEALVGGEADLGSLLDAEEACRQHPIWAPLNRAWTAVGVKR